MDSSLNTFPWPSTVNLANFVTVKPCVEGGDFKIWKEQMKCLLESQDVLGFVDGEILPPSSEKTQWRRTDRLVKGWILGSIGKDAFDAVWEKPTARDVWLELENIFVKEEVAEKNVEHYACPSAVNVANFITVKPRLEAEGDERSNNFKNWKEQMLCLLGSQDVLGFVDGEINNADQNKEWRRTDMLIKGWILGSIGKDLIDLLRDKPTARDVWLHMDNIFNKEVEGGGEIEKKGGGGGGEIDKKGGGGEGEIEKKGEGGEIEKGGGEDLSNVYLSLYKAAQRGDWDTAYKLFQDNNLDLATIISRRSETALHVAVQTGNSNHFVKKMVELMPREALVLKDSGGNTAMHLAAMVGNTEAAAMMIDENADLLYIRNKNNRLAVSDAAIFSHKEMLEYLISKSDLNIFEGQLGVRLLTGIVFSEFYDVALDIVYKCPSMARLTEEQFRLSALSTLAETPHAFPSGESFSWWQKLIYYCIPVRMTKQEPAKPSDVHVATDIENTASCDAHAFRNYCTLFQMISGGKVKQKLESVVWKIIQVIVPSVWSIRNKKLVHGQALELANYLCQQIITLPEMEATSMLRDTMLIASRNGIREVVEVIMEMYPKVTFYTVGKTGGTIFHLAASNRFENVFSLIYSLTDRKYFLYDQTDNENNNLMHLCGKLAPPHRLNLVPGAALQMQRELQWFKEMENFVHPSRRIWANKNRETPRMIFTNEHKQLKEEGERWMKDTANACTIAAALIATVMFTAAFTVPGGIDSDTGVPIFVEQPSFILFAISDAVSLFTSITSLLMFLSILTSRYAEEDFLYVLPKRLSIGLFSLFVSITFMLVSFSATMYLMFRGRVSWFLIPAVALTCLPVASFVLLQFPLLVDVIYSTYGPGIFGKKTNRVFY